MQTPSMTAVPSPTPTVSTATAPSRTPASTSVASPSASAVSPSSSTRPAPSSSPWPPSALTGTDWERLPTSKRVVALTFDGGSSDAGVASVLSTLAASGVHATVFLTGDFARRYPAQVRRIAAAGHLIGNHSDRHSAYPDLTDAQIRADLARARNAISAAGGGAAARYFRFPFGDRTPADIRVVNAAGYVTVRWTVDTLGWKGTSGGMSATLVRSRVLSQARPGQIVLMHLGANPDDGTTLDADALAAVITGLRDRGYSFVTVGEVLS